MEYPFGVSDSLKLSYKKQRFLKSINIGIEKFHQKSIVFSFMMQLAFLIVYISGSIEIIRYRNSEQTPSIN